MAALPRTVAITCPRCADDIECTLEIVETRERDREGVIVHSEARVPDLADRIAAHYECAGHACAA